MDEKLYTKEECLTHLIAKAKEELYDVESYNTLYESLKSHGHHEDAAEIEEIARQEFHHASIICDLLEERGYDVHGNADLVELWHKAKRIFNMV